MLKYALFLSIIILFCNSLKAEEALLMRVKVVEQEYTDFHPERSCENCIVTHFWYIHTAKIKNIISGDFASESIKYANLQHATYVDEYVDNIYIRLKKFKNPEIIKQLGVTYYIDEFIKSKDLVCFPKKSIETMSKNRKLEDSLYIQNEQQSCHMKELLDE